MFCERCNNQVEESDVFCSKCGYSVVRTNNAATGNEPNPYAGYNRQFENRQYENRQYENRHFENDERETDISSKGLHYLPLILFGAAVILFFFFGGDPEYDEVNLFDYLSVILSAGAIVASLVTIPSKRTGLKVLSLVLSIILLLITSSYSFL